MPMLENTIKFFPALQIKNYRIFWMTQWIALIGFWLQLTAQQWLVYRLTDSAILLGILSACQFAPSFLFTLGAGIWIDRHNKRKILMGTQFMYVIQATLLGLLLWSGYETYYWILFFAFFCGTIDAFDMPARLAFMPELVGKDALHSAISLNSANFNITRMFGPLLAAFLLSYLSYSSLFFLNALSLIPILYAYQHIKVDSPSYTGEKKHPLKELVSGLQLAKQNPVILSNLISLGIVSGLILNLGTYGPLFADRILHAGLNGFSFILFASGAGAMISGIISASSSKSFSQEKIFILGGLCGFTLMAVSQVSNFYVSMFIFSLEGVVTILFLINCNTIIQAAAPKEFTGRIMGLYTFLFLGSAPFGSLFVSFILETLGTSQGLFIVGLLTILLISLTAFFYYKKKN